MKEWFSSAELMLLNSMPTSVSGISRKAKRDNWKSRKASGGGRSLEYHVSNFDENIQLQLIESSEISDITEEDAKRLLSHLQYCKQSDRWAKEHNEKLRFENVNYRIKRIQDIIEQLSNRPINKKDSEYLSNRPTNKKDSEYLDPLNSIPIKNFVLLDFYDIEIRAGNSSLVIKEKQSDCFIFSRQFIENEIGVNTQNIFLMPVRGDSMAPTLKNQAIIIVSRIEEFSGDGVYVFRFDSQLMVKRLQFTKTGLNVVSDNTTYEPWQLSRDELSTENFQIIGEVVWSGQRM
ncbi:MAG: phage repressor protein C with HTH and peptisase S24 domain [Oleiphilaceae bacterium]|jgi:phage repressor protein C with HTH and peptisase S24 domain